MIGDAEAAGIMDAGNKKVEIEGGIVFKEVVIEENILEEIKSYPNKTVKITKSIKVVEIVGPGCEGVSSTTENILGV